jgi:hypothetical protein
VRKSEISLWASEIAALIAAGHTPADIAADKNIAQSDLDLILTSDAFGTALQEYGDSVVKAYQEYVEETDAQTARKFLSGRLTQYVKELDEIITSRAIKPEKRADILLALLKFGAPADESLQQETVRLSPATMENISRRMDEYRKHRERFKFGTADEGGEKRVGVHGE